PGHDRRGGRATLGPADARRARPRHGDRAHALGHVAVPRRRAPCSDHAGDRSSRRDDNPGDTDRVAAPGAQPGHLLPGRATAARLERPRPRRRAPGQQRLSRRPADLGPLLTDAPVSARRRVGYAALPRTRALVGTIVPAVTRTCSTFGGWLVDVPRTRRAPSAT